jgi:hypothetical protein
MPEPTPCEECRAILEQLRAASSEIRSSRAGKALEANSETLVDLMRGKAEAADELLTKFPFRPEVDPSRLPKGGPYWPLDPRIQAVIRRMIEHQTRTGHNVIDLFRK